MSTIVNLIAVISFARSRVILYRCPVQPFGVHVITTIGGEATTFYWCEKLSEGVR